jgi:hypothetical protein
MNIMNLMQRVPPMRASPMRTMDSNLAMRTPSAVYSSGIGNASESVFEKVYVLRIEYIPAATRRYRRDIPCDASGICS